MPNYTSCTEELPPYNEPLQFYEDGIYFVGEVKADWLNDYIVTPSFERYLGDNLYWKRLEKFEQ